MTYRDAILNGTLAAATLHGKLRTEKLLRDGRGPIDVFQAIMDQQVALIFRPLDGLLGARLTEPAPGVIISTTRPLSVQRFTGSHELGHVFMGHDVSCDGEEILRPAAALGSTKETEANAFAGEFLIPLWLLRVHAAAQGWNKKSLVDPAIVYQFALRLGASYEALCLALSRHKLIESSTFEKLRAIPRKQIKQMLLPDYQPEHWYRDVWLLTERDEGTALLGQPDDVFLFRLNEKSSAGYLWDIEKIAESGFAIIENERGICDSAESVGGDVSLRVVAQSEEAGAGEMDLAMRRPWQKTGMPAKSLRLQYDLQGKEQGFPRALRQKLMAV